MNCGSTTRIRGRPCIDHHLLKYLNPDEAKRTASQWYHEATGHWVGEKKGKNPEGTG